MWDMAIVFVFPLCPEDAVIVGRVGTKVKAVAQH